MEESIPSFSSIARPVTRSSYNTHGSAGEGVATSRNSTAIFAARDYGSRLLSIRTLLGRTSAPALWTEGRRHGPEKPGLHVTCGSGPQLRSGEVSVIPVCPAENPSIEARSQRRTRDKLTPKQTV